MSLRNSREDNYVYVYLDPRKPGNWTYEWEGETKVFDFEPFYVGRGIDGRSKSHMEPAKRKFKNLKNYVINKIEAAGLKPIYYNIFEDLDFDLSEVIEIDFIEKFGRRDLGQGPLTNRTFGGSDVSFERKYVKLDPNVRRYSTKSRRVDQFDLKGNFIKKWESIADINKDLGFASTRIGACCNGRTSHTYGFIWKFDGTKPVEEKVIKPSYKTNEVFAYKDGKFFQKFSSQKEFANSIGTTKSVVSSYFSRKQKTVLGFQIFHEYQGEICEPPAENIIHRITLHKFSLDMNLIKSFRSIEEGIRNENLPKSPLYKAIRSGLPYRGFIWKKGSEI